MFTQKDIENLLTHSDGPCISIYLPTARRGRDVRQNPIQLKNALNEAQSRMADAGVDEEIYEVILGPLKVLQQEDSFHQHLDEGLAIFLASDFSRHLLAPEPFDFFVEVADAFHVRPLLPLLARDGHFNVLALDRENVRLFTATRHTMRERRTGLPESWNKVRNVTEYQKQTGFHPSGPTPTTSGTPTPNYHAQGDSPADLRKSQTAEFVNGVANAVADIMSEHQDRLLVLCAAPELVGMFRQRYTGPGLIDDHIDAHPSSIDDDELHRRAYALVEPIMRTVRDDEAERFAALRGDRDQRAKTRIDDVVPAATQGRVETLFVARNAVQWGQVDNNRQRTITHSQRQKNDIDLLDLAARETLRNGGTIFTPARDDMPNDGPLAAIYRY